MHQIQYNQNSVKLKNESSQMIQNQLLLLFHQKSCTWLLKSCCHFVCLLHLQSFRSYFCMEVGCAIGQQKHWNRKYKSMYNHKTHWNSIDMRMVCSTSAGKQWLIMSSLNFFWAHCLPLTVKTIQAICSGFQGYISTSY